jgi:DNA-binding NtrC family response regulator
LRERPEDIPALAFYFLNKFSTAMNKKLHDIDPEALSFMQQYNWPGNIRELENAIERAVVICKKSSIQIDDLPISQSRFSAANADDKSLAALEKRYIAAMLTENFWNISRTAELLGIDRVTLYNKINKYNLRKPE